VYQLDAKALDDARNAADKLAQAPAQPKGK
jgi:hypothetical protein